MSNKLYNLLDTHDALVLDGLSQDDITDLYATAYFQVFEEQAYNEWRTDDNLGNDLYSNYYRIDLDNNKPNYYCFILFACFYVVVVVFFLAFYLLCLYVC